MKLTQKDINNLLVLVRHSRIDIMFDAGGTFGKNPGEDEVVDLEEVDKAEQAIEFIMQLIEDSKN